MDPKATTQPTTPAEPKAATPTQPAPAASQPAAPTTPPASPAASIQPQSNSGFPIKTVLLIFLLLLLAGGLFFIAFKSQIKPKQAAINPTPTVSPAHTVLALVQQTATSGAVLAVTADTGVNKITGVQFEIAYDPAVVSNVVVTPANFLPQPTVLLNKVDTKNGRISYAAVLSPTAPAVAGTGIVATISYTLGTASPTTSQTTFKFLPKSKVTEDGVLDSVLKETKDITLPLSGATGSAH